MGRLRDKAAKLAKKKAKLEQGGVGSAESKKYAKVTAKAEKVDAHIQRRVEKKAAKKSVPPGEMTGNV